MNRSLVLTGATLSAVLALAGCGGNKKAATVAQSASPKARYHTPAETRPATPAATVAGTVKVGGFCKTPGTVGKTTSGATARCQKKPGQSRARWYQAPRGSARAGQFCSRPGQTANSPSGSKLTCTKRSGETQPRWRTK